MRKKSTFAGKAPPQIQTWLGTWFMTGVVTNPWLQAPFYYKDSAAVMLANHIGHITLKLNKGPRIWQHGTFLPDKQTSLIRHGYSCEANPDYRMIECNTTLIASICIPQLQPQGLLT